jgi:hypothetical protein
MEKSFLALSFSDVFLTIPSESVQEVVSAASYEEVSNVAESLALRCPDCTD